MIQSQSIANLAEALAAAQAEIEGAAKDSQNPHLRNRYADLTSVWEACRVPLTRHGLAVTQPISTTADGRVVVTTLLTHRSGEYLGDSLTLPPLENKGINEAQAMGSAITYGRRYGLAAIVGVCPEDDDAASAGPPRGERQQAAPTNGHAPPPAQHSSDYAEFCSALKALRLGRPDVWPDSDAMGATVREVCSQQRVPYDRLPAQTRQTYEALYRAVASRVPVETDSDDDTTTVL